jgi:hypothetical protein
MTATCLPDANLDWAATLDAIKRGFAAVEAGRVPVPTLVELEAIGMAEVVARNEKGKPTHYRTSPEGQRWIYAAMAHNSTFPPLPIHYGRPVIAEVEDEETEPDITLTEAAREIPWSELPQSPKGLASRASAAGWKVQAGLSRTHRSEVLYVNDSDGSGDNSHRAGDVNYPAEDRTHYVLSVTLNPEVGFRLFYTTRHRERDTTALTGGSAKDPVSGRMSVFPGAVVSKFGAEADLTNVMTPTDFTSWFDTLVPPAKPRAPRKTKEERSVTAMLAGEEIQL